MSELSECTQEQLEEEAAQIGVLSAGLTGRLMLILAELDRRGCYPTDGRATLADWLALRTGVEVATAREHVRVARALVGLPLLAAALRAGEVSFSKVRALTRVATPQAEAGLLDLAQSASADELERVVRRMKRPTAEDAHSAHERRSLRVAWDKDGMLVLHGRLTAEQGALFLRALEASRDDLFQEHGPAAVAEQGRADALAALADRSLSVEAGRSGGDRTQVVVHVDAEVLAHPEANVPGRCELSDAVSVSAETSSRLACDCALVIMAHGAKPEEVSVGRKTRTVSPALRRAMGDRQDNKCGFPCCTNPIAEGHHVIHWAQGGKTDLSNVQGLCIRHHILVHEGGYRVEVTSGQVTFYRPDGGKVEAVPRAPRPQPEYLRHLVERQLRAGVDTWSLAP